MYDAAAVGAVRQQQTDGQQQLAALQPRTGMGQLGDRRGLDLAVDRRVARDQLQPERPVVEQLRHCQHGHIVELGADQISTNLSISV